MSLHKKKKRERAGIREIRSDNEILFTWLIPVDSLPHVTLCSCVCVHKARNTNCKTQVRQLKDNSESGQSFSKDMLTNIDH